MNIGGSNRPIYDNCAYEKQLYESTSPMAYQLYFGAHENCNKCMYDKFWVKYQLVDIESELRNQTRPLSQCDQFKYSPNCRRSGICLSTFDKTIPVTPSPEVCPVVYNNIPRQLSNGFHLPNPNPCTRLQY